MSALHPRKQWWTAAEIAAAALPDMPATRQNVDALAKRADWRNHPDWARPREAKGGGWEYNWHLFPHATRSKLLKDATLSMAGEEVSPQIRDLRAYFEGLTDKVKARTKARHQILLECLHYEKAGCTRLVAVDQAARSNGVSERTIWSWFKLVKGQPQADWLYLLAPRNKAGSRKEAKAICSPEFMDHLKNLFLQLEGPTFAHCHRDATRIAEHNGWDVLCSRTARRRLNEQVPRVVQIYAREGVAGLEKCFPPQIRSKKDMHALEGVNADCHKFDVFVEWNDGEVIRVQIVAFQDLYSGNILSWMIDRTPNAVAVLAAFRELVETYGIPEHCTFDNGREFANKWLSGGVPTRYRGKVREDDPKGIFPHLGVDLHWAQPVSGEAKPIERAFGDFARDIAKDIRFAGAYVGNAGELERPGRDGLNVFIRSRFEATWSSVPLDVDMLRDWHQIDALRDWIERKGIPFDWNRVQR